MNKIDIKKIYLVNFILLICIFLTTFIYVNYGLKLSEQNEYEMVISKGNEVEKEIKSLSKKSVTTDSVISKFVKNAIIESLSFEITKVDEQFDVAKKFFTDSGWDSYNNSINETLNTLIQDDLITMSAITDKDPILMNSKKFGGISFWKYYSKVSIRFVGKGGTINKEYHLIIILSQKKDGKNIRGLAIDSFEIK